MTIKEIILKANMVYDGQYVFNPFKCEAENDIIKVDGVLRYKQGLPVEDEGRENFVSKIVFYHKNTEFAEDHGQSTGCYVITLATCSQAYCCGEDSDRYLVIPEEVVAIVIFQKEKKDKKKGGIWYKEEQEK